MNANQQRIKEMIENYSSLLDVDPAWAAAIAMVESSLGENRISPTNCRGIFQMSGIAMEDLRQQMGTAGDDDLEILCGLLFLRLLYRRWGTIEEATAHYCDPNDRSFYLDRVRGYMQAFRPQVPPAPVVSEYPVNKEPKSWWERLWG